MTYLDSYSMTVYKYLKDNSLTGELQPGDRIHIVQDMEKNVKGFKQLNRELMEVRYELEKQRSSR